MGIDSCFQPIPKQEGTVLSGQSLGSHQQPSNTTGEVVVGGAKSIHPHELVSICAEPAQSSKQVWRDFHESTINRDRLC